MGTRSIIQLVGRGSRAMGGDPSPIDTYSNSIRLYRHYDGGPEENLPVFAQAIEILNKKIKPESGSSDISVLSMAQAIIASSMTGTELVIEIEKVIDGAPRVSQLGEQPDIEWLYIIDCNLRLVNVYTVKQSDWTGKLFQTGNPMQHLQAGFFNETDRVFRSIYESSAVEAILGRYKDSLNAVESLGWKVNEAEDPYIKLARKFAGKKRSVAIKSIASPFCI